ncbi:DUF7426 family protein (plasmid) [Microtetraspora malaysiensis]|uniref:DUF7426 family protein n=1 Tax=Microtetraspora malaysiensis TaxID=161358 RepID=UPI003D8FCF42
MTEIRDLDEFFDDTFKLPVGGKTYVIPAPDAETGLLCQRLMHAGLDANAGREVNSDGINDLASAVLDDDQERDLYQRILGPVYDELFADGVSWPRIQHVGMTALVWVAAGREPAIKYWESGGAGEAPAPNRATRRATAAAAKSTRSRGSATTTTRATASRSKKAATSRGKTS